MAFKYEWCARWIKRYQEARSALYFWRQIWSQMCTTFIVYRSRSRRWQRCIGEYWPDIGSGIHMPKVFGQNLKLADKQCTGKTASEISNGHSPSFRIFCRVQCAASLWSTENHSDWHQKWILESKISNLNVHCHPQVDRNAFRYAFHRVGIFKRNNKP